MLELKKKLADAPREEQAAARQAWASALLEFGNRHPEHDRARRAYREIELEYARLLASRGRYDEAIRFYQAALAVDPDDEDARLEMELAERRRFVTAESIESLERGMSREQVSQRIGMPAPGWSRRLERDGVTIESWYYRRRDGGVAGVFFRNGKLFVTEFERREPVDPAVQNAQE